MRLLPRLLLIILIVGVLAYPWKAASNDSSLVGFDRNYLYVDPTGHGRLAGTVQVAQDQLSLVTVADSQPTVILTASQSAFTLDFNLTINKDSSSPSFPFEIVVFYPGTNNRVSLWYYSVEKWIRADIERANYTDRVNAKNLGHYAPGATMHLHLEVVPEDQIQFILSNSTSTYSYVGNATLLGPLLGASSRAVEVLSTGDDSSKGVSSSTTLTNFKITVPNSSANGLRIADPYAAPAFLTVGLSSLFLIGGEAQRSISGFLRTLRRNLGKVPKLVWVLSLATILTQALLSGLANHPYDMFAEKVYSYSLMRDGLGSLYTRPLVTPAASPWGGAPFDTAVFVYPPLSGYYFLFIAYLSRALGISDPTSFAFEFSIKMVGAFSLAAGGILTYFLVKRIGGTPRTAILGATFYMFNPVLIYDTAVWGQTDSFVALLLVSSALFLASRKNSLFWITVLAAIFVKQTAIIPALLLIGLSIRSSHAKQILQGVSAGMGFLFLALLPYFALGYSPQVSFTPLLSALLGQVAGTGATSRGGMVSADAYTLPPLLSYFSGATGRDRMYLSASSHVPLTSLTYSLLGASMFLALSFPIVALVFRRGKTVSSQNLMVVGGLTLLAELLFTGVSPRYFGIAVALMIPAAMVLKSKSLFASLGVLSATSVLSMHGLLILWDEWYPGIFAGIRFDSPLNRWLLSLYLSDQVMTLAILANLVALAGALLPVLRVKVDLLPYRQTRMKAHGHLA